MSFMDDSAAPRDFRISSISYESESKCTKCPLCYNLKRSFFCTECLRAGEFFHSTDIHSESFADKKARFERVLANKKLVEERCRTLLLSKRKGDDLRLEQEKCKERIILIKLAIEQTRNNVLENKEKLSSLVKQNSELNSKLPNYKKCVFNIIKVAKRQHDSLDKKGDLMNERESKLASLRRMLIKQVCTIIFPMHITMLYLDSFEADDTILKDINVIDKSGGLTEQLHMGAASIPTNSLSPYILRVAKNKKLMSDSANLDGSKNPLYRMNAGLLFSAQLTLVLSFILDIRLPYPLKLNEMSCITPVKMRRVCVCVAWLCAHACSAQMGRFNDTELSMLYQMSVDAKTNNPQLGTVQRWMCNDTHNDLEEAEEVKVPTDSDDEEPPEHLQWGEWEEAEVMTASTAHNSDMLSSRVSNATASIVSFLKGWTTK